MQPSSFRISRASRSARLVLAVAGCGFVLVPLAHCTSDAPITPPATLEIGPAGGALASSDYVMEIVVPPGALSANVVFTITPVNAPGSNALAPAYTITSDTAGLTFAVPAVVSYTEQAIASPANTVFHDATDYRVAAYNAGAWAALPNQSVDGLADTIEGTTRTLSTGPYSIIVPGDQSNCQTVTQSCAAGTSDAGCIVPTCDPVLPGKCSVYPGSVAQSCTVQATSIATSCCVPPDVQTCFLQSEPLGCDSPCSNYPGSTATSCIPNNGPPFENGGATGAAQSTCCYPAGTRLGSEPPDGGTSLDSGADANGSTDAGADASAPVDAGLDAGTDSAVDSGSDAGQVTDAGGDTGTTDASDDGG